VIAVLASVTAACNAAAVLAQLAAASGGAAWKTIGEVSIAGKLTSSGLHGRAELHQDVRTGRYAIWSTLPIAGTSAQVYDGRTVWSRDVSGGVHPYDSWYPRARAVTEAFLTRRDYFDPRTGASAVCVPQTGTGRDELVRVTPRGGIPAVLAIDPRTHLLDSVAIRTPISTDLTTYGDYRQVGRIVLPFFIASGSIFEPENGDRIDVTRYTIAGTVTPAHFAKPVQVENAHMFGGAKSTTVPIAIEGRQLLVWASINGRSPMPFIVDSGGHAILDTVAAKMLGVRAAGTGVSGGAGSGTIALQFARVASVRIGNAELVDQPFLVIPYPYAFYERGRRVPLAGILGLEWFERYAIRIDYAARTLTLTPLQRFSHRATASAVPLQFQEDMPLARAAADGHDGAFGVDTGNAGVLILYGDFLKTTGLLATYGTGMTLRGEGTGGSNTGQIQKLRGFEIGGRAMRDLDADFTQMKTGSFSSWTEAGDLGLTVLSRFTPTFDYAKQMLYLDPVRHPFVIPRNRSGMAFTKNEPGAIDVVAVRPQSAAAAAGITAGDRVIAVGAKSATEFSSADFLDMVTAPAGTVLQLTIRHGTATRTVALTLR
jgi:hypothetical protein